MNLQECTQLHTESVVCGVCICLWAVSHSLIMDSLLWQDCRLVCVAVLYRICVSVIIIYDRFMSSVLALELWTRRSVHSYTDICRVRCVCLRAVSYSLIMDSLLWQDCRLVSVAVCSMVCVCVFLSFDRFMSSVLVLELWTRRSVHRYI